MEGFSGKRSFLISSSSYLQLLLLFFKKTNVKEKKKCSKGNLNLLQWNAEGLGAGKTLELKKLLKDFTV